jgi:hypothetical protein
VGWEIGISHHAVYDSDKLGFSSEHVCGTLAKLADDGLFELSLHTLRVMDLATATRESGSVFLHLQSTRG